MTRQVSACLPSWAQPRPTIRRSSCSTKTWRRRRCAAAKFRSRSSPARSKSGLGLASFLFFSLFIPCLSCKRCIRSSLWSSLVVPASQRSRSILPQGSFPAGHWTWHIGPVERIDTTTCFPSLPPTDLQLIATTCPRPYPLLARPSFQSPI